MNYHYLSRQKTLHFGEWPTVSLADARARRDDARRQLAAGLDPIAEKKADQLAQQIAATNMFKAVAEEWVTKNEREGRAPVTLDKIRWLLGIAYPMIGDRPVSKISPQEVLAVRRPEPSWERLCFCGKACPSGLLPPQEHIQLE